MSVLVTNMPFWSDRVGASGTIDHFQEPWPEPLEVARRRSDPETPPPIAGQMGRYIGRFLMGMRRGAGA